jgi:hypothetical protein
LKETDMAKRLTKKQTAAARKRAAKKRKAPKKGPVLRRFVFNWKSGGGNDVMAHSKAEALAMARKLGASRSITYGGKVIVTDELVPDSNSMSDSSAAKKSYDSYWSTWD